MASFYRVQTGLVTFMLLANRIFRLWFTPYLPLFNYRKSSLQPQHSAKS